MILDEYRLYSSFIIKVRLQVDFHRTEVKVKGGTSGDQKIKKV